jgi:anti-sigma B factor antagonist
MVVTAVPGEQYPAVWGGQVAVVSLPAEIDIANGDYIREDLLSIINRGPALLVVDMSVTDFCDSAGVNALIRAFKRAAANGAEMRLVVPNRNVQRILALTGVDRLIDIYPSVSAATADVTRSGEADPDDRAAQPT